MNFEFTKLENFDTISAHLINIILMNDGEEPANRDEEITDFDFDFAPNEM